MFASHFRIWHQLTAVLLELPGLTTALEGRAPNAVALLVDLLNRAETQLTDNKLRQAADLAASRAAIAAARMQAEGRTKAKQAERLVALQQIGAIRAALAEAIGRSEAALDSARPAVRQLLQLVAASGAVRLDAQHDVGDLVDRILQLASGHDQLKPLVVQLRVALDRSDILLLMADEVDLADFLRETE